MKIPTSTSGGARFRGPTSSSEYNNEELEKYNDIVELYKVTNDNNVKLLEKNKILLESNVALQRALISLKNQATSLERQLEAVTENSTWYTGSYSRIALIEDMKVSFPSKIDEDENKQPRCELVTEYRYATIPMIHHLSKTHMTSLDGSFALPNDLKVSVTRTSTTGIVKDNNYLNMFDGDDESYWTREVSYPLSEDINSEDAMIEIELPLNMVNDLNVNSIQINPFPENGVKIKNVEVYRNNGWEQIVGFEQKELSVLNDSVSPRRKWCFSNIQITKARITLEQFNYSERSGRKVFALGLQEVGIYLSTFDSMGGIVMIPFDMSKLGAYRIEGIEPIFLNRSVFSYSEANEDMLLGNIYNYELYEEEADSTLTPIQESTLQTARKVWVKIQLLPDPEKSSNINPCLTAVRMNFVKE